jgi:pimeloyl-ACP methyl ester carboxylesterase
MPQAHLLPGEPQLAVQVWDGPGPDVLLLHGAGRTSADWHPVAADLARDHRVLAVDLRSHGASGGGAWSFPAVLDDLDRLAEALALRRPAVVGHSLGGIVAALWAERHPCRLVLNLDGLGPATLDELRDVPRELAQRWCAQRDVLTAEVMGTAAPPLPEILAAVASLDLPTLWLRARLPLVLVQAVARTQSVGGPDWFPDYLDARARGLATILASSGNPLVQHVLIDATHDMLLEAPDQVVRLVRTSVTTEPLCTRRSGSG